MPKQLYTNNAVASLAATIGAADTSITIGTGFANFSSPTGGDFQMATITDGANIEIIKITARSFGALTVVRAQEGTTAQSWTSGAATVSARVTAGMLGQVIQNQSSTADAMALAANGTTQVPVASGQRSIAIGRNAQATNNDAVSLGTSASSANTGVAVGASAAASGTFGVALGSAAAASGFDGIAVGASAQSSSSQSIAIGRTAISSASSGVAVGYESRASASKSAALGVGARAVGSESFAGPRSRTFTPGAWSFLGHPTIQRNDWSGGDVFFTTRSTTGAEGSFASMFVDLGNIPPWAPSTSYTDGDVIRPTIDNGKQYFLTLYGTTYDPAAIPNTIASGGSTEPSWTTVVGDYTDVPVDGISADFTCIDLLNGLVLDLPDNTLFFPTEFGFICFKHANVTAAPFVSIGTAASPNLYVNNQQLTGITGALQIQRLTPLVNTAVTELQFKLNTKATGTDSQFHGRFYAKGLFIQVQG